MYNFKKILITFDVSDENRNDYFPIQLDIVLTDRYTVIIVTISKYLVKCVLVLWVSLLRALSSAMSNLDLI